jgi:inhibitor of KinA sporulation pathway (predicted exonuclease)
MKKITEKELLELFLKYSRHDMNPKVCKGCSESHHYILCPYDFLMNLDDGAELNDKFQRMLREKAKL